MKKAFGLFLSVLLVAACGSSNQLTRGEQYQTMYEEKPLTLLIMPPINNTSSVEAKDLLYTSISKPLAEAGYYVLPPLMVMDVLKAESAYDSELFIDGNLGMFNQYFGADAVVFSVIDSWTKSGFGIQTKIRYIIKSVRDNAVMFDKTCDLYLDLSVQSGGGGLLGSLIDLATSVISTAVTDHIVAARKANSYIFSDIPRGKYSSEYMQDQDRQAMPGVLQAVVK